MGPDRAQGLRPARRLIDDSIDKPFPIETGRFLTFSIESRSSGNEGISAVTPLTSRYERIYKIIESARLFLTGDWFSRDPAAACRHHSSTKMQRAGFHDLAPDGRKIYRHPISPSTAAARRRGRSGWIRIRRCHSIPYRHVDTIAGPVEFAVDRRGTNADDGAWRIAVCAGIADGGIIDIRRTLIGE